MELSPSRSAKERVAGIGFRGGGIKRKHQAITRRATTAAVRHYFGKNETQQTRRSTLFQMGDQNLP